MRYDVGIEILAEARASSPLVYHSLDASTTHNPTQPPKVSTPLHQTHLMEPFSPSSARCLTGNITSDTLFTRRQWALGTGAPPQ